MKGPKYKTDKHAIDAALSLTNAASIGPAVAWLCLGCGGAFDWTALVGAGPQWHL